MNGKTLKGFKGIIPYYNGDNIHVGKTGLNAGTNGGDGGSGIIILKIKTT